MINIIYKPVVFDWIQKQKKCFINVNENRHITVNTCDKLGSRVEWLSFHNFKNSELIFLHLKIKEFKSF